MKLQFRILWAALVALIIAVPSWIMFPEYGWQGPVGWIAFVTVIYTGYELRVAWLKRRNK